jgi:hypothetical protein
LALALLATVPQLDGLSKENAGDYSGAIVNTMMLFGMFLGVVFAETALSSMLPIAKCSVCKHTFERHENKKGEVFEHCKSRPIDALLKRNTCTCSHFEWTPKTTTKEL